MTSISTEEENYVRMSLLLTGISPRAVRVLFDSEFHPSYVPDSKTFDVTLMITLLRNLTTISPLVCGFDDLPSAVDTKPGADLARIKYYRNYMAHLSYGKIDTNFFNTAWNDMTSIKVSDILLLALFALTRNSHVISGNKLANNNFSNNILQAIERLGGQLMKQECDYLKTKPLDQTNQEIMLDIKRSNDEIRDLKESFKSLSMSHTEIKKSHELLQEDHADVSRKLQKLETSQKDTVPWNVRGKHLEYSFAHLNLEISCYGEKATSGLPKVTIVVQRLTVNVPPMPYSRGGGRGGFNARDFFRGFSKESGPRNDNYSQQNNSQQQYNDGLCFYCKRPGHTARFCPYKARTFSSTKSAPATITSAPSLS
ncbi:unnamed protein product [Mytilus edulis]|uniref:CCHC-type domain-containing protein n=1 Tax=Mytilus edulis TaxID=6550 RepID=A0A8S3S1V2_MYTED|nr:unnamed protein product [Mytilus edulis]